MSETGSELSWLSSDELDALLEPYDLEEEEAEPRESL
jgi:hypothetical protein